MTREEIKANRDKLSAALRSGEWKQYCDGALEWGGAYCCLGVGLNVVCGVSIRGSGNDRDYSTIAGALAIDHRQRHQLWRANDTGTSFPEIADMIDALPLPEEVTA